MKRFFKIISFLSVFILSLFCFIGCVPFYYEVETEGLENFGEYNQTSFEQFLYIVPEGFLEKYEYKDGNYYYSYRCYSSYFMFKEKSLVYLKYEPEVYQEAKAYVESEVESIYENQALHEKTCGIYNFKIRYKFDENRPEDFTAYATNDETNTLLFIAFTASVELTDEVEKDLEDWDAFVRFYFQWYDFDK